jgi:hypothetical protein
MEYDAVIDECKDIHPLPDGYSMKEDGDNVIVSGPNLGFCMTASSIERGYFREQYRAGLPFLIEKEAEFLLDPTNPCWNGVKKTA